MGFSSSTIKDTAEKITGPEVCKDVFASDGTCVDQAEVKKML